MAESKNGKRSILDVEDEMITRFCDIFGDMDFAMPMVRQQFDKAKVDFRAPTPEGLAKVADRLATVIEGMKGAAEGRKARTEFQRLMRQIG